MAEEQSTYDPERCTACRGTGQVISSRGETQTRLECPWCGGTGRRQPGRNAQEFAPERPEAPADAASGES